MMPVMPELVEKVEKRFIEAVNKEEVNADMVSKVAVFSISMSKL